MTTTYPDHPQLRGNYAPIRMECDIDDVIVRGELPADLDITYYRNGPDPQYPPRSEHHWFAGDGMLHMFRIQDGRVRYRNRWVRTDKWRLERGKGRSLFNPFNPMDNDPEAEAFPQEGLANTSVIWHGGKLLALEEGHAPFEVDAETLDPIGAWRFDGRLEGPMTAHPKVDPKTGELILFGYMAGGPFTPTIRWHAVDAAGQLTRSERFDAPFCSMVHDFIVTGDYVVFPVFPVTGSLERAMAGGPAFAWEPDKGTHIGVARRDGSGEMRWFETDPCFVYHPMNAYSDDDRIVAHVMQFEQVPLFTDTDGRPTGATDGYLTEWVIDLNDNSNSIARRRLDDATGEFPRVDDRFACGPYRHGYHAGMIGSSDDFGFNAILHHDFGAGRRVHFAFPDGDVVGEPVFVPRTEDAEEGDGYLLALVYRGRENRSDLVCLDADNVADGPVACAELPHRVPFGFHGNWKYNA